MSTLLTQGRRLFFVGGKGGVGKTSTASALAVRETDLGKRVLLVSTDPAHSLGDLFGQVVGNRERELHPGLWGLEIEPENEVESYLEQVKGAMRSFVQPGMYGEIERQLELARHSPGATEAALMERTATLMIEATDRYDRVIFDTAPTGHTLRLLTLPEIMTAWMDGLLRTRDRADSFGRALDRLRGSAGGAEASESSPPSTRDVAAPSGAPRPDELSWFQHVEEGKTDRRSRRIREALQDRRRRFSQARRLLLDPEFTAFIMVLIPEKLPILETEKALRVLTDHRVPIAGLVVNRCLPAGSLGDFMERRRVQELEYRSRIDRMFRGFHRVTVPLLDRDVEGVESLRTIAKHLSVDS